MYIKSNDLVQVITGKEKNKQGVVLKVYRKKEKVIVEGVNIRKRHKKDNNSEGSIQNIESPIHVSNVQLVCPKTNKPTRIKYKIIDGKKHRISVKSGEIIDKSQK